MILNALTNVNKLNLTIKCYVMLTLNFHTCLLFGVNSDSLYAVWLWFWNTLVPFGKICTWKISHTFRPFSEQLFTIMFPMMLSGACAAGVLGCYCGVSVVVTSAGDTADSICPGSELLCGDWILEMVNRLSEPYCRQQHLRCQLARRTDPYTCMPVVN